MNDKIFASALNAAATAAQEEVLNYAHGFERREDYLPLEELAERVQHRVLLVGSTAARFAAMRAMHEEARRALEAAGEESPAT